MCFLGRGGGGGTVVFLSFWRRMVVVISVCSCFVVFYVFFSGVLALLGSF